MRKLNVLNTRSVATLDKAGWYADGGGLYLRITNAGSKFWVFRYRMAGKIREMGLGGVPMVALADAREMARDARRILNQGGDPLEHKRIKVLENQPKITFSDFATPFIDEIITEYRNAKHAYQWKQTINIYAKPLHNKPIDAINTADVLHVLKPIWTTKQETASRLRGRLERIFDAAKAKGLRTGENPAALKGNLAHLLSKQKQKTVHMPALPYVDVPAFMAKLRLLQHISAKALEFTILTASRTGETIGAQWSEIDFDNQIWTIPEHRIKAGRTHRVPLTNHVMTILEFAKTYADSDYIFRGGRSGKPLSNMAMLELLRGMLPNIKCTVHGFRSSFRDWSAEETNFQREVIEAALAHIVGDETERAYRRGDALEKRRKLMQAWGDYCGG